MTGAITSAVFIDGEIVWNVAFEYCDISILHIINKYKAKFPYAIHRNIIFSKDGEAYRMITF